MHAQAAAPSWISYAVPAAVFLLVMAWRARNVGRLRPLKMERLWIIPALYLVVAAGMFLQHPPVTPLAWMLCALALAIGAALGWQRGRLMRIHVDPETHAINQQSSMAALVFIFALILVRSAMRSAASAMGGASLLHLNAMALTDILVALALGLLGAQRLEMYLRARRLLEAARGARA